MYRHPSSTTRAKLGAGSALIFAMMVFSVVSPRPATAQKAEAEEAPESAVSSPPMEMDDPGTPGEQGIEVNFVGTFLHAGPGRGSESLLDANYGIGDRLQLKLERPYLTVRSAENPFQDGLGATELGVKWRFIDHAGLAIAAYPQYSFNDAFTLRDAEGNPEDGEGRSFYFPVLISQQLGEVYTAAANLGFRRNLENLGDDVVMALGAGRAVGGYSRVLVEVYSERDRSLNNRQTDVRMGYFGTWFPDRFEKSKLELSEFASFGHSIGATEDGEDSTSFTFGLSIVRKPRGE